MSFTVELYEKWKAAKAEMRTDYGIVEKSSTIKMISDISKLMPEDTTSILLFTSGTVDYLELNTALKECMNIPVIGGVASGIGDFKVSYKEDRAIVIFLNSKKMPVLTPLSDLNIVGDSLLFTTIKEADVSEFSFACNHSVFGTNLKSLYYEGEKVPENMALVVPQERVHLHHSVIHNGLPEDYKNDFLELTREAADDWSSHFIVTCEKRIERMGDIVLEELEEEKTEEFKGTGYQGFGIGGLGVILKSAEGIVQISLKTLGFMKF